MTELWVDENFRKRGLGRSLMNIAKDYAKKHNFRMVILETQSCNTNAIGFYLHEGFTLAGVLPFNYTNTDIQRKEVRFELGWFNNVKNFMPILWIFLNLRSTSRCTNMPYR